MSKLITSIDVGLKEIVEIQKKNLEINRENKELFAILHQKEKLEKLRSSAVLLILLLNFFLSIFSFLWEVSGCGVRIELSAQESWTLLVTFN